MRKDIADRLVAALRSGEYKQGQEGLCTVDLNGSRSFCCLGVLTDLAVKEGVLPDGKRAESDPCALKYGKCAASAYLPDEVQEWSGMQSIGGSLPKAVHAWDDEGKVTLKELAHFNDAGYTFEQIADIIEKNWEAL